MSAPVIGAPCSPRPSSASTLVSDPFTTSASVTRRVLTMRRLGCTPMSKGWQRSRGNCHSFARSVATLIADDQMDSLVRASLLVRRVARGGYGFALTCLLAGWVVAGGATAPLGVLPVVAALVWAVLLLKRLRSKLRLTGDAPFLLDFELGALLAVGLDAALLRFDGTLSGRFSPATYVLVALVASFGRPIAGLAVVGWVVALDALIRFRTLGQASLEALATQAGFASAFALLNLLLLRAE